jgi:4-hydroxybenzoate polyprenyltransferase
MKLLEVIKLSRPINLLIIGLTMLAMRYFILQPMLETNGFRLQMTLTDFCLLILSVQLITAAGNIINDYFDQKADRINKPKDVIVGVTVKRRWAMALHVILNIIAVIISIYLSFKVGIWKLCIIHLFAIFSLWYYSLVLKKTLLVGNILVAIMTGLVPLIVALYEIPLAIKEYGDEVAKFFEQLYPTEDPLSYFMIMYNFCLGFSLFAFLLNFIREIQKDMADVEGDKEMGARTLPILWGNKVGKIFVSILIMVAMFLLFCCYNYYLNDRVTLYYLLITVTIPMAVSLFITIKAVSRNQFIMAGNIMKIAMLNGIIYSVVYYKIYYHVA